MAKQEGTGDTGRFYGPTQQYKPGDGKPIPVFDVEEPDVKKIGPPWWEEPCLGPSDAQVGPKGKLINQEALQARQASSGPPNPGEAKAEWEPTINESPLNAADFHNRGKENVSPGTKRNVQGDGRIK